MTIYPAIDLRAGRVVRLMQGKLERQTEYARNPVAVAKRWARAGAEWLHVVDLDGAFAGSVSQRVVLRQIAEAVNVPIQFGGGLRSLAAMQACLDAGASRLVVGSMAVSHPELLQEAVSVFGSRVAVAIDVLDGAVRISGWQRASVREPIEFLQWLQRCDVSYGIVTDVKKDGMLTGPSLELIRTMKSSASVCLIASGGVSTLDDLRALKRLHVDGVIVGKALYERQFTLPEALCTAKEEPDAG